MAQASHDNYIRCHAAVQLVLSKTIPCLQNAIDSWHLQASQRLQSCTVCRPNFCQISKKPATKHKHCPECISWAQEIENQLYRPTSGNARDLQWSNADPTLFGKDSLEVIKLFALRLPVNPISSLGDFDPASLLMIMANFKVFHNGNQAVYDQVKKVSEIRNSLAHLKLDKNLNLDNQTFSAYWTDITDFVNAIQGIGRRYFTQSTAQDTHEQLKKIKTDQSEALRPLIEDVLLQTIEDNNIRFQGDPLDVASCQKILKGRYRQKRGGIGFLPGFPKEFPSDEFFVELELAEKQKTPTEVKYVSLKTYTDLLCLQDKQGKPLDHVLVTGLAGTGKTTLVSRLAYQWATVCDQSIHTSEQISDLEEDVYFDAVEYLDLYTRDNVYTDAVEYLELEDKTSKLLNRFDLVFALDIRKFKPHMTLVDAIKDQLLSDVSTQALHEYLLKNAYRCLFLFDGYDELSSQEQVLSSDALFSSNVILTSRPDKIDKINHNYPGYVNVSLNGFSEESVSKFVHKFFGDSRSDVNLTKSQQFLTLIHESHTLRSLSYFPLLLAMMCLIYQDQQNLPETISGLFDSIVKNLVQHWKARKPECADISIDQFKTQIKLDDLMVKLGYTAFKGLYDQDSKLIFKDEDFQSIEVIQNGCEFGLLSRSSIIKGINWETEVSFIHKTFQEYCAGMYLASLVKTDRGLFSKWMQQFDSDDRDMQNVLMFCCGSSIETSSLALSYIVNFLKPKVICKDTCDTSEEYQQKLRDCIYQFLPILLLYEVEMKFGFNQSLHDALKPIVTCFHGEPHYISRDLNALIHFVKCRYQSGWLSFVKELCIHIGGTGIGDIGDIYVHILSKFTCLTAVYIKSGCDHAWDEISVEALHCLLITLNEHQRSTEIAVICYAWFILRESLEWNEMILLNEIFQMLNAHSKWHLKILRIQSLVFTKYLNQSNYLQIISNLCELLLMESDDDKSEDSASSMNMIDLIIKAGEMQQQESLANCRHLVQLSLQKLTIYPNSSFNTLSNLPDALKYLGSLKSLHIVGPNLDVPTHLPEHMDNHYFETLGSEMSKLTNLQSLKLSYIQIGNGMKAILYGISHAKLTAFHLVQTHMTEECKDVLFGIQPSASHGPDMHPDTEMLHEVPSLWNMQHLTELTIKGYHLASHHAIALSEIMKNMSKLTELDLSQNKISSNGLLALFESFQYTSNLSKLGLRWNNIGPDGLLALCNSFQYTPNLSELILSFNNIGSDGAVGLANSFEYISRISHIDLYGNPLGPVGIEAILMNIHLVPDLAYLDLGEISKEEVQPGTTLDIILRKIQPKRYYRHDNYFTVCEKDCLKEIAEELKKYRNI